MSAVSVASAESPPLPQAVRARWLSLDGTWSVELEPGGEPLPIEVPFPFEAPLSGIGRGTEVHERLRYRRSFAVPEEWRGEHVLLRFGAVDWQARVFVDGREVGVHEGGYTHFSFDLGPVEPGEHELLVDVWDPREGPQPRGKQRDGGGIWYTRTTGIWRPVWLEPVPRAHVESFELDASADGRLVARVAVSEPTGVLVRCRDEVAPVGADGVVELRVPGVRPWSPEDPALYDVVLETESGDRVLSYAGFRTVERRGTTILLNGRPRRFVGVLDQGFWPGGVYTAPSDEALAADVVAAKEFGFDLARMHVKVADPRWYAWCDRIGLLVAQDFPSSFDLSTEEARAAFVAETDEIVAQLRSHPSVVIWIAFNEDWGRPGARFQLGLAARTRERDPSRLVVDASGWIRRGNTDLVDVHDYGDDLSGRATTGDVPLWLGECGGVQFVADGASVSDEISYAVLSTADELAARYERLVGQLGDVAGFVWTQLTDVEGELNGFLTYDRVPKLPPDRIREANTRFREETT